MSIKNNEIKIRSVKPIKIYALTNKTDGKVYIGQTQRSYNVRMGKNGRGYEGCLRIHEAIQKHGVENFEYITLAVVNSRDEANELEKFYTDKYKSQEPEFGYNIREGGINGAIAEETRVKLCVPDSPEVVARRVKSRMEPQEIQDQVIADYLGGMTINAIKAKYGFGGNGKIYRILEANNISLTNDFSKWTGKIHSDETKLKMSEARRKFWDLKNKVE